MSNTKPNKNEGATRPTLGLVPRFIRLEQRRDEVYSAIQRYLEAGEVIPLDWVVEFNELIEQLKKR